MAVERIKVVHERVIAAGIPIYGVDNNGVFHFADEATDEQRQQAQQIWDSYDQATEDQQAANAETNRQDDLRPVRLDRIVALLDAIQAATDELQATNNEIQTDIDTLSEATSLALLRPFIQRTLRRQKQAGQEMVKINNRLRLVLKALSRLV